MMSDKKRLSMKLLAGAFCALTVLGPSQADDAEPDYVAEGKEVFGKICKFCHGKSAYPGKAPKLNPARYTPEFVYDRVTNGFRGMPAFKEQFTEKERQAVVTFILSKDFSN
jgi:mono/diheme cytochrome c family protein